LSSLFHAAAFECDSAGAGAIVAAQQPDIFDETRYHGRELSCSLWEDTVNSDAQNRLRL